MRRIGVNSFLSRLLLVSVAWCLAAPEFAYGQRPTCFVLCEPELKIEPTFTWENLFRAPRIEETDENSTTTVKKARRERVFETVVALDIPTSIPRTGFTFEVIVKPFTRGSSPELETELNFQWLTSEDTNGWVSSHFDIVDKYSPGGRPHNVDRYTHKLNFELDTAVPFLKWTRKPWLSDIEIEGSLDYVATGLARSGDRFGNIRYLENASRWSFSLVFVVPFIPLSR